MKPASPAQCETLRQRLALTGQADTRGGFEILAISAGVGNGWVFSPAVLYQSLELWEGVQCFIDHAWTARSVRDLAGVCTNAAWDDVQQGITLNLRPLGPGGALLTALGEQVLTEGAAAQVGFSADVMFTAHEQQVQQIMRVLSVDLVVQPARGGAFLRALNAAGMRVDQSLNMKETEQMDDLTLQGAAIPLERALLTDEVKQAQAVRLQLCEHLLGTTLGAAHLPAAAAEHLRKQFSGRSFEPDELTSAIDATRKLVSDLTGAAVVNGPGGRIHGMADSRDQLQAAVDDLLGAPRQAGAESMQPARLSGIRELYLALTGDYDLHGGYFPQRMQLATTADFSGLVKNALNKVVVQRWQELGRAGYDWWQRLVSVEHFNSLNQITGTLVGTVGDLPSVAEGAEYTELAVGDSPETASFTKYGGYIPLTLELIDRDETRKLRAYPMELASAGLRKISRLVAAVFTDTSGAGPLMADGGALFNANAVTGAGGHANLSTTALGSTQWDVVSTAVYNQPRLVKNAAGVYGSGPRLALNPRYCLVPRALQLTALKVLSPAWENSANIHSENMQRGLPGDVVTVPEWTDATDWAAVCDPIIAPAIYVGERFGLLPEIFIAGDELSPAVFMNDEHRLKVRHTLAVWVNDFRPLHKANVAG